jgi:hydroxymethylpyrimidine/phosphomethylpyrimidine kinase
VTTFTAFGVSVVVATTVVTAQTDTHVTQIHAAIEIGML